MSSYTEEQVAYKESLKGVALSAGKGDVVLQGKKNKYVIKEVLGSGGYAITYRATARCDAEVKVGNITAMAHDVEMEFAIKEFVMEGCFRADDGRTLVIPSTVSQKCDHAKAAFKKEAEILKSLSGKSDNIVPVNEYIEANGTCYYVMQYLKGGNLCNFQEGREGMPENAAIAIIKPICRLLENLHTEYHLLHLDVKPDNIMVTKNSRGRLVPVLIDFGVAKHFDKEGRPTTSHFFQGATRGYAPIEQCSNAELEQFDSRIEVYSVGATLYYLLTKKDPPDAVKLMNGQSVLRKELEKHGVSERTINAILKAMKPAREDRVGTPVNAMGPFLDLLEGKIDGGKGEKGGKTEPLKPNPDSKVSRDLLVANKNRIVETLRNFGIEIVRISAKIEPTQTFYEINPAYDSSISMINELKELIAHKLKVGLNLIPGNDISGIDIIAPIPNRGTIGISVRERPSLPPEPDSIWTGLWDQRKEILIFFIMIVTIVLLALLSKPEPHLYEECPEDTSCQMVEEEVAEELVDF